MFGDVADFNHEATLIVSLQACKGQHNSTSLLQLFDSAVSLPQGKRWAICTAVSMSIHVRHPAESTV